MADDVVVTAGNSGTFTHAADEISGVKYPRVKLIHGADGVNAGDVSTTNGLPTDTRYVGGTAVNATPVGFQRVSDEHFVAIGNLRHFQRVQLAGEWWSEVWIRPEPERHVQRSSKPTTFFHPIHLAHRPLPSPARSRSFP